MSKIRVGVIGCGMIANAKHLPSLMRLRQAGMDIEVTALCDTSNNPGRLEQTAARFGLKDASIYTDYNDMLEQEDLSSIHVCTSNRYHGPISVAALSRGINVLCEKPMAINRFEAREMVQAAKSTGAVLSIGYQNRYRPDVQQLKAICDRGELGEVYYIKAMGVRRRNIPTWGKFLNKQEQGGGALIDVGCHALDLALWLSGDYSVKNVLGRAFNKLGQQCDQMGGDSDELSRCNAVEDAAVALVTMHNGHALALETSWALNTLDEGESRVTLCGTLAGADMRDGLRINSVSMGQFLSQKSNIDTGVPGFYSGEMAQTHVMEAEVFYNAILGRGELVVQPEQALIVTEVIDAIYESSRLGKMVTMSTEN